MQANVRISGFYDEVSSDLETQLKLMKKLGESYICPRGVNGRNISSYTAAEFERDIKPVLDSYGAKFSSIGSPIGKIGLYDDEAYERQKKQLEELIGICKLMDCRYIRMFSFHVDPKGDYSEYRPVVMKKLKGFAEVAAGSGVTLLHENEKKIYGDISSRCLEIYEELGGDGFELAFDASNYIQCSEDPREAYKALGDKCVYFHIKDCSPEKVEVPLGMGDGGYKEMLSDLILRRGYDGFFTLEPHTAKYAVLKNAFNILFPITALVPPVKEFHKVFRRIDEAYGISRFGKVSREQVFVWQYEALKKMLAEIAAEAGE